MRTEDGVDLHVEVDEGPNPTVIFCHGWMGSSANWDPVRVALKERARTVVFDQRGHGRSGATRSTDANVDRLAQDLAQIVAPYDRVVLVGHSMGSMAIQRLAVREPELFGKLVVGVLLCNTLSRGLSGPNALLKRYGRYFRPARPLIALGIRLRREELRRKGGASASARTFIDFHRIFVDLDVDAGAKALSRVDTVIVGGSADQLTPIAHSTRLADSIVGARLRIVPGAGHLVPLDRPEIVTDLLLEQLERVR